MAKKRADQLKSLSMPKESMADSEASVDLEHLGMGGDESQEGSPEEEGKETGMEEEQEMGAGGEDLSKIPDEDLIAELKKRGMIAEPEAEAEGEHQALGKPSPLQK